MEKILCYEISIFAMDGVDILKKQKEIRKTEQNISFGTFFAFAEKESQCIENSFTFKTQPSFSLNLSIKTKELEF